MKDPVNLMYDQAVDLRSYINLALGPKNSGNLDPNINRNLFRPRGSGIMEVQVEIIEITQADIDNEEDPIRSLARRGYENLGNTWDLASLLHLYPTEVVKWAWVYALGEDSRWAGGFHRGAVYVPVAWADRVGYRSFRLDVLSDIVVPSGVVVIR